MSIFLWENKVISFWCDPTTESEPTLETSVPMFHVQLHPIYIYSNAPSAFSWLDYRDKYVQKKYTPNLIWVFKLLNDDGNQIRLKASFYTLPSALFIYIHTYLYLFTCKPRHICLIKRWALLIQLKPFWLLSLSLNRKAIFWNFLLCRVIRFLFSALSSVTVLQIFFVANNKFSF